VWSSEWDRGLKFEIGPSFVSHLSDQSGSPYASFPCVLECPPVVGDIKYKAIHIPEGTMRNSAALSWWSPPLLVVVGGGFFSQSGRRIGRLSRKPD
jgi:hypothetical protein